MRGRLSFVNVKKLHDFLCNYVLIVPREGLWPFQSYKIEAFRLRNHF
jgi:hypothetical protein